MRWSILFCFLGTVGIGSWSLWSADAVEADTAPGKTALQADPGGWTDLFPGKDLQGWKRVAIAPDTTLNPKNAWSVDPKSKTLICDGVGVKEMLLQEQERTDGIFHVEWRFRPVTDKKDYNSGVYVRSAMDGKTWVQAQVAHLKEPPFLADLFADVPVDGQAKRVIIRGQGDKLAHPPGEWNTFEVTCKGKKLTVAVNGTVATTWDDCPFPKGHVGMQAEFYYIEFRNLKYKELR